VNDGLATHGSFAKEIFGATLMVAPDFENVRACRYRGIVCVS